MATHREAAEEACKAIPPTTDDWLAKRGTIHALLSIADEVRASTGALPPGLQYDDEAFGVVLKAARGHAANLRGSGCPAEATAVEEACDRMRVTRRGLTTMRRPGALPDVPAERDPAVAKAREYARDYSGYDGEHHKQYALVKILDLLGGRVPEDVDRGIPA